MSRKGEQEPGKNAPEITLLPSESKEDFVYVDTQLNLTTKESEPLLDRNCEPAITAKRSHDDRLKLEDSVSSKKARGTHDKTPIDENFN